MVSSIIDKCIEFNRNVYLPDVKAIGGFYKNWLYGGGLSGKSVLAYGDIPENANDFSAGQLHLPRGAVINGNLGEVHDVDQRDPEQVQEFVDHSWYEYTGGEPGKGVASMGWCYLAEVRTRTQCQGHQDQHRAA